MSHHGHPLAGLTYISTTCEASPEAADRLFVTAHHVVSDAGVMETRTLAGPQGAPSDTPVHGRVELIAEQGEALIFRTHVDGDASRTTVVLTLHAAAAGELFATDGDTWVRAIVAIEALPAIAHQH